MDHLKFPRPSYSPDGQGHDSFEAAPLELKVVQDFLANEINTWERELEEAGAHHKKSHRIIELMAQHAEELDIDISSLSENVGDQIQEASVDEISLLSKLIHELKDIYKQFQAKDYTPVLEFLAEELERKSMHTNLAAMHPRYPTEEKDAIQNQNACRTAKETLERYLASR